MTISPKPNGARSKSSASIAVRVYANAYSVAPQLHTLTWDELASEIVDACENVEAPGEDKRLLPALSTVVTDPPDAPRANEHIVGVGALVLDVDKIPENCDAAGFRGRAGHLRAGAVLYATSSDAPAARRFRVVLRLSRVATPEEAHHLRFVVAEALGLEPGMGVETARASAQLFFVGRLKGSAPRDVWTFEGPGLDVDALAGAPLKHAWPAFRDALPTPARTRGDTPAPGLVTPRVEATAEALLKAWPEPGEITPGGGRRPVLRALGGWLARLGWSDAEIVALVERLPTARGHDVAVTLAVECARQCRDTEGEVAAGYDSLRAWAASAGAGSALALAYEVAKDPRMPEGFPGLWNEWWARVYTKGYRWLGAANSNAREDGKGAPSEPAEPGGSCSKSFSSIADWIEDRNLVAYDTRGLFLVNAATGKPWRDADTNALRHHFSATDLELAKEKIADAIDMAAHKNEFDPVVDYLNALPAWDGVTRSALTSHFGAVPGTWSDACWRVLSISAVARALEPGCKVDTMICLEGGQGLGKSSGLRALAGGEHFSDTIMVLDSPKQIIEGLAGVWIQEIAELSGLRGRDAQRVKAALSSGRDRTRLAYARNAADVPRRSIFVATNNPDGGGWLSDTTGNRRHLPIIVGRVDVAGIARDRDQLWAEAVARYHAGEQWWLTAKEEALQRGETEARTEGDPWASEIEPWLAKRKGKPCAIGEVLAEALLMGADRQDQRAANRAARVLKGFGWERFNTRVGGKQVWRYGPKA